MVSALVSALSKKDNQPLLTNRLHGACIVYPSETYNPPAILDALHGEQCTAVHGVPTHFLGLLEAYEKDKAAGTVRDFSRLR